jgi:excisionase family DNA binding protein
LRDLARLVAEEVASKRIGWLDVRAAATYLSMSEEAIRNLVKRARIPHHRTPNGRIVFKPAELDSWIEGS